MGADVKVSLKLGDITQEHADAIVNAANSTLVAGGGVDGAIHAAGGPAIQAECRQVRRSQFPGGLPAGEAVATTAGDLPARWVIHTVGTVYSRLEDRSGVLAACYRRCLAVADELEAETVAFPAVSAGAFGWPASDAARIAVTTVANVSSRHVHEVRFVLFTARMHAEFAAHVPPAT